MPIYEYACDKCSHRFEKMQKFTDPPVGRCPSCGSRRVRKLMSNSSFHLKGSGWYVTDYARKGGSGGEKQESSTFEKGEKKERVESKAEKAKEG